MSIEELYQLFLNSRGVSTDSRALEKDQMFFALRGDIFDGNEYAAQAIEAGAAFAVIDNEAYHDKDNTKYILVEDSLKVLQDLSTRHRKEFKIPFIGITGSNGKTTTKELIRDVLKTKYLVSATKGNLNNHIGVPLTLLSISYDTDIAIIEMGANKVGDIKELCEIALPDYGLITNIGKAHLEGFGNEEGVLRGKTELYKHLKANKGRLFINGEDERLMDKAFGIEEPIVYGISENTTIKGEVLLNEDQLNIELDINGTAYLVQTNLYGTYNLQNVVAAAAIGLQFNIAPDNIIKAIEAYEPQNNRSQVFEWKGNTVVLDAYNANPTSMQLAIESFVSSKYKQPMVILGEMNEIGKSSDNQHKAIYQLLKDFNIDDVILVGQAFKKIAMENGEHYFEDADALKLWLLDQQYQGYHMLIKGSRSNELEKLFKD